MVKAVVPKLIKALLWKLAPLTVKVKSDEPALMLLGLRNVTVGIFLTMNSTLREVPPVSVEVPGLVTVTGTIPEEATREAGTVAVKVLLSRKVVDKRTAPKLIHEVLVKLAPPTVRVKLGEPAATLRGFNEIMIGLVPGWASVITNDLRFEYPPQGDTLAT